MTKRFNPPSARRLGAVAIAAALAAFAGVAGAQTRTAPTHPGYVTNNSGDIVKNAFGGCVVTGQAPAKTDGACPPGMTTASATGVAAQPRTQVAQAAPAGREATVRSAATGSTAPEKLPGYAVASDGKVVLSGFGQCVRAGHWTAANAAEPCDRVARAELPPPPVAVAPAPEPKLEPAPPPPPPAPIAQPAPPPAPVAAPEPPRPVIQKLTLATDVLFDFNKAELKESGKKKLDDLAAQIKDANVDEIIAIGHADRIASEEYNQKLSEERAQAVRDYLTSKVANANKVTAQGKGESAPITGDDCKKMGPESAANKKLVACLQPDRRVEIEVLGSRQVAAGEAPAAGGGTGTSGTGTSAPAGGSGSSAPSGSSGSAAPSGGSPAPSGGPTKN